MSWNINKTLCQNWANNLIKKHNVKRLEEPCSVDPYDLIDLSGARLSIDYLTPTRKFLGATVFEDSRLWVWPDNPYFNGMNPEFKLFSKGTIIIDKDLAESNEDVDVKITNFTFLHEIFHCDNHKDKISENYHITQKDNKSGSPLEQEANFGASLFWMPENAVKNVFIESFGLSRLPDFPLPFNYDTKPTIQEMAQIFSVNYSPMVYRLQELNLINWTWGHY